jgi:tetratricopeptide (TPR) repeat protein
MYDKAIADYGKSIKIHPQAKDYLGRAQVYELMGEHKLAESDRLMAKDLSIHAQAQEKGVSSVK